MFRKLIAIAGVHPQSSRLFVAVWLSVSVIASCVGAFSALRLPDQYFSTARIKVTPATTDAATTNAASVESERYRRQLVHTGAEVLKSDVILAKVLGRLEAQKPRNMESDAKSKPQGSSNGPRQLKASVFVRPLRDTNEIEATVLREVAAEAAWIANTLVETYQEYHSTNEGPAAPPFDEVKVEILDRATAAAAPTIANKLIKLSRAIGGALLLGLSVTVLSAWCWSLRRKPPDANRESFRPVFLIVFGLILGTTALLDGPDLALMTTATLLVAFAAGSLAEWFVYFRHRFSLARNPILLLLIAVFLFVFGWNFLERFPSSKSFACSARLSFGYPSQHQIGDRSRFIHPALLSTECAVIQSAPILDKVIQSLDLNEVLARQYAFAGKLATKDTRAFLSRMIELRVVPWTSLVEIRVSAQSPGLASSISSHLVEVFKNHQARRESDFPNLLPIRVTSLGRSEVRAGSNWARLRAALFTSALPALTWVFAAGLGVAAATLLVKHKARRLRFALAFALLLCTVSLLLLSFLNELRPAEFSSRSLVRLLTAVGEGQGNTKSAKLTDVFDEALLKAEASVIKSDIVLGGVVNRLAPKHGSGGKVTQQQGGANPTKELDQLRDGLFVRPLPGTSLIEIIVVRGEREESVRIANAVAEAYTDYARREAGNGFRVDKIVHAEVVESAGGTPYASQHGDPLGESFGQLVPMLVAFALGAGAWWIAYLKKLAQLKQQRSGNSARLNRAKESQLGTTGGVKHPRFPRLRNCGRITAWRNDCE